MNTKEQEARNARRNQLKRMARLRKGITPAHLLIMAFTVVMAFGIIMKSISG